MSDYPCPYCDQSFPNSGRLRKHFANRRPCNEARQRQLQKQAAEARRNLDRHDQVVSPRPDQVGRTGVAIPCRS